MGFRGLRGRGVPLVVAGPDIIYGCNIEKIRSSLAAFGYRLGRDDAASANSPQREKAMGMSTV
jgi:hypothetical protein